MVEEIPFPVDFRYAVVRRPADLRLQENAIVAIGPLKRIRDGVADEMRVAGRIGEVVFPVLEVQPARLEKAPRMVARPEGLAFFVYNYEIMGGPAKERMSSARRAIFGQSAGSPSAGSSAHRAPSGSVSSAAVKTALLPR